MKKLTLLGFLLVLTLLLAACNMPGSLPTCPTEELLAPVLVAPLEGGTVSSLAPSLTWAYPDSSCNPEGYRIDLSLDEDFADTSLSGGTGNPSTTWGPGSDLENCQVYYWRVAGINDTTLGPFSEAHTFRVDLGDACPPVAPPPSAAVGGIVWHDLCAPPLESGGATPQGCVTLPGGGFEANGIRDTGEPGIEGIEVRLHFGTCNDPVVATQRTGSFGEYVFDGILAFGEHCVSIDALSTTNEPILIPGGWTFPSEVESGPATATFNLESGSNIQKDFGWDYQFLPMPSTPENTPTLAAFATQSQPSAPSFSDGFNVTVGANCRQGPGTVYDVIASFTAGTNLRVVGRNDDSSWWLVEYSPNSNCWISNVTGQFVGSDSAIPTVAAPPTPTPTPTGTSGTPGTPGTPETPGTPGTPETPETPGTPGVTP